MNITPILFRMKPILIALMVVAMSTSLYACAHKHRSGAKLHRTGEVRDNASTANSNANRNRERTEPGSPATQRDQDRSRSSASRAEQRTQRDFASQETAPVLPELLFAFDSAQLSVQSRAALNAYARWLTQNRHSIRISGHTDERGTREYNLALGRLRAQSALDLMLNAGVPSRRIEVVSYGEELPAVRGSGESAWRRNRRIELEIL
jgi:peptidoglycan-associated lipoprotein